MNDKIKRMIISIVVLVAIYFISDFVIGWSGYDMYLEAIKFLTAVIGAGCYWIGSNERKGDS